MPIIVEIRWTPAARRQLAEWVAAFARDPDVLRLMFAEYEDQIEDLITEAGGYPDGRVEWGPADARVIEWEFIAGNLWITHGLRDRPGGLWSRIRGRRHGSVLMISALRRPRTAPERETPGL